MLTIMSSILGLIGGPIWLLNGHRNFYSINEQDIEMSLKKYDANGFGIANHLAMIACFISYKKWVQWEKCPSNARLPYIGLQTDTNLTTPSQCKQQRKPWTTEGYEKYGIRATVSRNQNRCIGLLSKMTSSICRKEHKEIRNTKKTKII
jgi:hypothetical protein